MTRFDHVKEILETAIGGQNIHAHGPFWRGLTRHQFVEKKVFGEQLLIVGNGANSNLLRALKGEPPFGADTGNPTAEYSRMPAGMDPVPAADIAFLETWINEGCLEDPWPPLAPQENAGFAAASKIVSPDLHTSYWREFDNRTLYAPTLEVSQAVEKVLPSMSFWRRLAKAQVTEQAWEAVVQQAVPEIQLLSNVQIGTVTHFYGSPIRTNDFFDSYQQFGADTLPDDPLRSDDPRHRMNGSTMWFVWSGFADACQRLNIDVNFWNIQTRAILIGLVNDGLMRRRFNVTGFTPDPGGQAAALSHFSTLPDAQLPAELTNRYLDSKL